MGYRRAQRRSRRPGAHLQILGHGLLTTDPTPRLPNISPSWRKITIAGHSNSTFKLGRQSRPATSPQAQRRTRGRFGWRRRFQEQVDEKSVFRFNDFHREPDLFQAPEVRASRNRSKPSRINRLERISRRARLVFRARISLASDCKTSTCRQIQREISISAFGL